MRQVTAMLHESFPKIPSGQFSFYVADRLHVAELGFTVLLTVIASKVVGVLTSDIHREPNARRADEMIE
jgi:hypothetical protein